jgi:hypothetical protein
LGININGIELGKGKILGDKMYLSGGEKPKTQGQLYTGVAYQDDIECS